MPTYEYECPKCGNVFDEFQSISAPPLAYCPKEGCGAEAKRRFSAGGGFILKGSGFYATDYRSDSYKSGAKAENPAAATAASPSPCGSCSNAASCAEIKK
jgi:putative FmdB family regulatory protein